MLKTSFLADMIQHVRAVKVDFEGILFSRLAIPVYLLVFIKLGYMHPGQFFVFVNFKSFANSSL